MTDYQRFDELVSSAVRASSVINKVDILKMLLTSIMGRSCPPQMGSIGSFSFPQNTIFPIWVLSVNC